MDEMFTGIGVGFGPYPNHSVEELILEHPGYIEWALRQPKPGRMLSSLCQDALRSIRIFDRKPYLVDCEQCKDPATRCVVHKDSPKPAFRCERCFTAYSERAAIGLCEVRSFLSVPILFRDAGDAEFLVRAMARAKGLPASAGRKQIRAFFRSDVTESTAVLGQH